MCGRNDKSGHQKGRKSVNVSQLASKEGVESSGGEENGGENIEKNSRWKRRPRLKV
jgi:hypothetical protein